MQLNRLCEGRRRVVAAHLWLPQGTAARGYELWLAGLIGSQGLPEGKINIRLQITFINFVNKIEGVKKAGKVPHFFAAVW